MLVKYAKKNSPTQMDCLFSEKKDRLLIVRYANKKGQLIDQVVLEEYAENVYSKIKKEHGEADLILRIGNTEYCLR